MWLYDPIGKAVEKVQKYRYSIFTRGKLFSIGHIGHMQEHRGAEGMGEWGSGGREQSCSDSDDELVPRKQSTQNRNKGSVVTFYASWPNEPSAPKDGYLSQFVIPKLIVQCSKGRKIMSLKTHLAGFMNVVLCTLFSSFSGGGGLGVDFQSPDTSSLVELCMGNQVRSMVTSETCEI